MTGQRAQEEHPSLPPREPTVGPTPPRAHPRGLFARLRIRKKLIVLHTTFSAALAVILLLALRPALAEIVRQAEIEEARVLLRFASSDPEALGRIHSGDDSSVRLRSGNSRSLGLSDADAERACESPGEAIPLPADGAGLRMIVCGESGEILMLTVRSEEARAAVVRLYLLLTLALLAVYGLVVLTLEVFILPQHVYRPIRALQLADRALQLGAAEDGLIPESDVPADELGDIMRSRNESIRTMRRQERALEDAVRQIEQVATDLKRKNYLLEATRQNLADADRLASLGMMSAGIAHELNTPLAVIKGTIERVGGAGRGLDGPERDLLLRVVGRLERLSESLLDFARARPPVTRPARVRALVGEAMTLVRIDRDASGVEFVNTAPEDLQCECDADRMIQVLVNLVRNAVDVVREGSAQPRIEVSAERSTKEGADWVSIVVSDNGPGIDPSVLPTLFEPFVSTRLDARGTGLGLAVAEGIVDEHGGVILAGNRPDRAGARFEVLLPARAARSPIKAPGEASTESRMESD